MFPDLIKRCNPSDFFGDICELATHKRCSYPLNNSKSIIPCMVINMDVWGPSRIATTAGYKGFLTFIDCFSRVTWIYLLYNKNEVYGCFLSFHKMIETQFDAKIRVLQSDNGKEYIYKKFQEYLTKKWDCESTNMCEYTSAKWHC